MNKTPSILVNSGFEVDQNGALTEIVIPQVVTTYNAPRKITFMGQTLNWMPSTATALHELECPNMESISTDMCKNYTALTTVKFSALKTMLANAGFSGCTALTTVHMPSLISIGITGGNVSGGAFLNCTSLVSVSFPELSSVTYNTGSSSGGSTFIFGGCTGLTTVDMPKLESVTVNGSNPGGGGLFVNCTSLTSVNMPSFKTATGYYGNYIIGMFYGCTGLSVVNLPSLISLASGTAARAGHFTGCTGLSSVTLGSIGHPVSSLGNYTFGNCTQSGLTITIYTQGGAALSGEPWGATGADIEYEEA